MCKDDDTRWGRPAGTEIKTHQTELKCASYLHPFFFMMFPSTTSALQKEKGRKAWLKRDKPDNEMRVYCGLPRERSKLKKCTLKEHLFQIAGRELAIRSESVRPVPSCVTEPPLCHSLAVTGALISDSTIFKAGQKPVTMMSLQSSL